MQGKTERIEQARKELDQYVQTQCKGLSTQACTTMLQASQSTANTVTEILTGFTPAGIAIDIKDLLQAKTMGDYVSVHPPCAAKDCLQFYSGID